MKKIVILLLLISTQLYAQDKTLYSKDIIDLLNVNNHSIRISSANKNLAKAIYDQVINSSKPKITFSTDSYDTPLLSYDNYTTDTDSYSVSGGITVNQKLPTGGNFNIGIDETFEFNYSDNEDVEILQTPGIDLTITQPIFYNNKFIDFKTLNDAHRLSNISYNISKTNETETKNQIIIGVLTSIHSINIMRNSISLLNKSLEIAQNKVVMGKEDRTRGRISSSELLNLELNVAKENEALFNKKYQLTIAEINLERVLGLEDIADINFDLQLFNSSKLEENISADKKGMTTTEYKAALILEQSELTLKQTALLDAVQLSLFFYSSFEDLNTNSDLYINFGATINANIWDGGVNKKKLEANQISIEIAEENLKDVKKSIEEDNKVLRAKIELLKEKTLILKANIIYDEQILEREKDLQSIGSSTSLNVEVVELDLLNIERDLENINGELYITILQLAAVNGFNIEEFI